MSLDDIKSDGISLILNTSRRLLKREIMYNKKNCDILSAIEVRNYPEPLVFLSMIQKAISAHILQSPNFAKEK